MTKVYKNKELVELFFERTISTKPDIFVEVGCFEASASKYISKKLPNCSVFAYEANPYNYNNFKDDLKQHRLEYINSAISNFDGNVTFYLQERKDKKKYVRGNNSLSKRNNNYTKYKEVTVECKQLDTVNYQPNSSYALWIDAEGNGLEVLLGADKVLKQTKVLLIEVESKQHWVDQNLDSDIISYMENLGFTAVARDQEYPQQYNILFEK